MTNLSIKESRERIKQKNFISFRFAAAQYLWTWFKIDKPLFDGFGKRQTNPDICRELLTKYGVARTLAGKGTARLKKFITALDRTRKEKLDRFSTGKVIHRICLEVENEYKKNIPSAVSKCMWMIHRHPVAIYDRWARDTLMAYTGKRGLKNYELYYDAWWTLYEDNAEELNEAMSKLPKSEMASRLEFVGACQNGEVKFIANQDWFRNRVFDNWLVRRADSTSIEDTILYAGILGNG